MALRELYNGNYVMYKESAHRGYVSTRYCRRFY